MALKTLVISALAALALAAAEGAPVLTPEAQEPAPPAKKRFEEQVEVVAEGTPAAEAAGRAAGAAHRGHGGGRRRRQRLPHAADAARASPPPRSSTAASPCAGARPTRTSRSWTGWRSTTPTGSSASTSAFNPETVRGFDLYAGAFSAKYGDRLSSLLVVENRPGTDEARLRGLDRPEPDRRQRRLRGPAAGASETGSWIVTARRTYYDLVANRLVGTRPAGVRRPPGAARLESPPRDPADLLRPSEPRGDRRLRRGRPARGAVHPRHHGRATTSPRSSSRRSSGGSVSSRTIASFYVNRDQIDADAQFRNEARRSNAPGDEVGLPPRRRGLRPRARGARPRPAPGARLRAGAPTSSSRASRCTACAPQTTLAHRRRPQPERVERVERAGRGGTAERPRLGGGLDPRRARGCRTAGRRAPASRSRRASASTGAASTGGRRSRPGWPRPSGSATRPVCGPAAASSPRAPATRSSIQSDYFVDLSGDARALAPLRAGGARGARSRARLRPAARARGSRATGRASTTSSSAGSRPRRSGSPAWPGTTSRPSSPRASPPTPSSRASR